MSYVEKKSLSKVVEVSDEKSKLGCGARSRVN
jgi:hypothetical protein